VYSSNSKLIFSHVNFSEVTRTCVLNTPSFPDSLVLVTEDGLLFGAVDDIQKLQVSTLCCGFVGSALGACFNDGRELTVHATRARPQVRTVLLGEAPYRLAYQEESRTVAVITQQEELRRGTLGHIQLVDCTTFEILDSMPLDESELPMSIASLHVDGVDEGAVYVAACCSCPTESGFVCKQPGLVGCVSPFCSTFSAPAHACTTHPPSQLLRGDSHDARGR
jgi:DNA damage-binding protein 1